MCTRKVFCSEKYSPVNNILGSKNYELEKFPLKDHQQTHSEYLICLRPAATTTTRKGLIIEKNISGKRKFVKSKVPELIIYCGKLFFAELKLRVGCFRSVRILRDFYMLLIRKVSTFIIFNPEQRMCVCVRLMFIS